MNKVAKNPEELNSLLNTFNYGLIIDNRSYVEDIDWTQMYKSYKTLSPEVFEKFETGVCWDYVIYQANYFEQNFNNEYKTYYIELKNKMSSTHTFMVYEDEGETYYFESSYKKVKGIRKMSTSEAFDFILRNMFEDEEACDFDIYEYDARNVEGMGTLEFMDHAVKSGKKIKHTIKQEQEG